MTDIAGETHYYWSSKVPLKNEAGEVKSCIGFSNEITELVKLKQDLEIQANYDDLTQINNCRALPLSFLILAEWEIT